MGFLGFLGGFFWVGFLLPTLPQGRHCPLDPQRLEHRVGAGCGLRPRLQRRLLRQVLLPAGGGLPARRLPDTVLPALQQFRRRVLGQQQRDQLCVPGEREFSAFNKCERDHPDVDNWTEI